MKDCAAALRQICEASTPAALAQHPGKHSPELPPEMRGRPKPALRFPLHSPRRPPPAEARYTKPPWLRADEFLELISDTAGTRHFPAPPASRRHPATRPHSRPSW